MSLKSHLIATCFGLTRPSSGNCSLNVCHFFIFLNRWSFLKNKEQVRKCTHWVTISCIHSVVIFSFRKFYSVVTSKTVTLTEKIESAQKFRSIFPETFVRKIFSSINTEGFPIMIPAGTYSITSSYNVFVNVLRLNRNWMCPQTLENLPSIDLNRNSNCYVRIIGYRTILMDTPQGRERA
jgi:hypothetical protein